MAMASFRTVGLQLAGIVSSDNLEKQRFFIGQLSNCIAPVLRLVECEATDCDIRPALQSLRGLFENHAHQHRDRMLALPVFEVTLSVFYIYAQEVSDKLSSGFSNSFLPHVLHATFSTTRRTNSSLRDRQEDPLMNRYECSSHIFVLIERSYRLCKPVMHNRVNRPNMLGSAALFSIHRTINHYSATNKVRGYFATQI